MTDQIEKYGIKNNGIILFQEPLSVSLEDWYETSGSRRAIIVKDNNSESVGGAISVIALSDSKENNTKIRDLYDEKYNDPDKYFILQGFALKEGVGYIGSCI